MRLVFTTSDYVRARRPTPGFPLLLGDDMQPLQPFHDFLQARIFGVEPHRAPPGRKWTGGLDSKTWDLYGRCIWDFCSYLKANSLQWDQPFANLEDTVVMRYRDASRKTFGLKSTTINQRLRLVAEFYEWARHEGLVRQVPFTWSTVYVKHDGDLAHIGDGVVERASLDQELPEWDEEPAFLTGGQVREVRMQLRRTAHQIVFDLMADVGLRACEARTFPTKYVVNPQAQRGVKSGHAFRVHLDPKDMEIKYDKPRVVHVPWALMEDMRQYQQTERKTDLRLGDSPNPLVLTRNGTVYSKSSLVQLFADVSRRTGIKVTPLMLRHSYAIHMLLYLRRHPQIEVEPLMYVRDRLGHSSVETTMIYLTQIERLLGEEALAMMTEFDALYSVGETLSGLQDKPLERGGVR